MYKISVWSVCLFYQRISGQVLGRDLRMFGESLSSGVDIDDNGYQGNSNIGNPVEVHLFPLTTLTTLFLSLSLSLSQIVFNELHKHQYFLDLK